MTAPLHATTKVLPGNRIEVSSPELREGEIVEVIVISRDEQHSEARSALEIIESLGQHRIFASPAAVDRHLQEERESWDR